MGIFFFFKSSCKSLAKRQKGEMKETVYLNEKLYPTNVGKYQPHLKSAGWFAEAPSNSNIFKYVC